MLIHGEPPRVGHRRATLTLTIQLPSPPRRRLSPRAWARADGLTSNADAPRVPPCLPMAACGSRHNAVPPIRPRCLEEIIDDAGTPRCESCCSHLPADASRCRRCARGALLPTLARAQAPAKALGEPPSTITDRPRDYSPGTPPVTHVDPYVITIDPCS